MCVCIYSLVKISNFVNQGSLPSDAKNQSLKLCAVDGVDLVSKFFFSANISLQNCGCNVKLHYYETRVA